MPPITWNGEPGFGGPVVLETPRYDLKRVWEDNMICVAKSAMEDLEYHALSYSDVRSRASDQPQS